MKLKQVAITGKEEVDGVGNEVYQVLREFYQAFNTRDSSLMQQNWLNSDEIFMSNPLGGVKRGWKEIYSVYKHIFNGNSKVYVEFYDYNIIEFNGGFCAVGRERGWVKIKDKSLDLKIRTSRIYKLVDAKYKQVHHHGSIENPQLLEQYQNLVKQG